MKMKKRKSTRTHVHVFYFIIEYQSKIHDSPRSLGRAVDGLRPYLRGGKF